VASLPADIPFVFRHWSDDDASPWHQYIVQYRTEYTYRRFGVQRGTPVSDSTSDSRNARQRLRDASARYSADNVTDDKTLTTCHRAQSEPVKRPGRTGHRSAPASFAHGYSGQQHARVVGDEDNVTITTVSLQLPSPLSVIDHQLPAAKSVLRCPAIRIHLNNSSSAAAGQQSSVALQSPSTLPPAVATSSLLPRVVTDPTITDSRTQQSPVSAIATDSYSTFSGRMMRHVPSNGFSIDDRTVLVCIVHTTC